MNQKVSLLYIESKKVKARIKSFKSHVLKTVCKNKINNSFNKKISFLTIKSSKHVTVVLLD